MSATAATLAPPRGRDRDRRPGLGRLVAVELRKVVDTRAGFWLLLAVAGLTVAVSLASCLSNSPPRHTLSMNFGDTVQPAALLLPVLGVMLVTGEWSQRTALQTFTLVPQRGRVLMAKVLASIVLSAIAVVLCLVVSLVVVALLSDAPDHRFGLSAALVGQALVFVGTGTVMGVGFGAALLLTPLAIVLLLVLPIGWSAATDLIPGLDGAARWLDQSRTLSPLTDHLLSGAQWARAGTTLLLWMVLPLVVGAWRVARNEPS